MPTLKELHRKPFRTIVHALALLCLSLVVAAASAAAEAPQWRAWAEEAQKQHPLAGRLYDVASGKLTDLAGGPGFALPEGISVLGEVHDNPMHHRLRGWLITETLRAHPSRRPAVVFEHIRADQQPALDAFKAANEPCCRLIAGADVLRQLQWDKSGWPPAPIFAPLFDAVLAGGLAIYPGDPPREKVRAVARGGLQAVAAEERTRLKLDLGLPAALAAALDRELVDSHCGAMSPEGASGMALAQRYRDAHQAVAAIDAAARHGSAILIAGNGHARADRGVPWHIRQRAPGLPVTSVLHLEVEDVKTDPAAYVPRDPEGKPAADMVIFTIRVDRGDPCERFKKKI